MPILLLLVCDDIGLGFKGHIAYTAARTKFINDVIDKWIMEQNSYQEQEKQQQQNIRIVNLGAGFDTRVYWLDSLRQYKNLSYFDIDTAPVNEYKTKLLSQVCADSDGKLSLQSLCSHYKCVSMDFSKQSK